VAKIPTEMVERENEKISKGRDQLFVGAFLACLCCSTPIKAAEKGRTRSRHMFRTTAGASERRLQRPPTRFFNGEMRIAAIHANQKVREYQNAGLVQILDTRKMEDHLGSEFLLTI
jgi:hypothetical protein